MLEHVADPETACRELMRIAKRGYLECPRSWFEFVLGSPQHRWLVNLECDTLIFREKLADEDSDVLGLRSLVFSWLGNPAFMRQLDSRSVRSLANVEFYSGGELSRPGDPQGGADRSYRPAVLRSPGSQAPARRGRATTLASPRAPLQTRDMRHHLLPDERDWERLCVELRVARNAHAQRSHRQVSELIHSSREAYSERSTPSLLTSLSILSRSRDCRRPCRMRALI